MSSTAGWRRSSNTPSESFDHPETHATEHRDTHARSPRKGRRSTAVRSPPRSFSNVPGSIGLRNARSWSRVRKPVVVTPGHS